MLSLTKLYRLCVDRVSNILLFPDVAYIPPSDQGRCDDLSSQSSPIESVELPGDSEAEVRAMFMLHNHLRLSTGANPLKLNNKLCQAAAQIAKDQMPPDNVIPTIQSLGYKGSIYGLNTSIGAKDPTTAMSYFTASKNDVDNIVKKQFKEIGVAIYSDRWCVIFSSHLNIANKIPRHQHIANLLVSSPIYINQ